MGRTVSLSKDIKDVVSRTRDGESAIKMGRGHLQWMMKDDISQIFQHTHYGHMPNLALPSSIMPGSATNPTNREARAANREVGRTQGAGTTRQEDGTNAGPAWMVQNPSIIAKWKIPASTTSEALFNFNDPRRRSFCAGWPKAKHHKIPNQNRYLCIKYQVEGTCRKTCNSTHKPSDQLTPEEHEIIGAKVREAIAFQAREPTNDGRQA